MKVLVATAIYPTADNPAWGAFVRTQVEFLKRAGIEVELLVLEGPRRKLAYLKALFDLRRRLADGSIDLVHAHYGYVGMVARTQQRVPVVVSFCGDDVLGTVNRRGGLTVGSRLAAMAGRLLSSRVDAVIVKSREMAAKLGRAGAYVIPHEVDLDVFRPVEMTRARALLGLHPYKKYLLFAGNPQIPVKRFPLAKAVAEELRKADSSVELQIACKESQQRLALLMNACDVLIFTSYQEGSPNVVKQAMACNLPIVATDVGDVSEVIGKTEGCYVCKPDAGEFTERIAQVLRRRTRTNGRENIRHLAGPAVAQRIIEVYTRVLRTREARAANRAQTTFVPGK